jgi:hypothetical protein
MKGRRFILRSGYPPLIAMAWNSWVYCRSKTSLAIYSSTFCLIRAC